MSTKRRILGFTGIRSDYDLMSSLYRRLAADERVDFRLLISGAHLSETFGSTVRQVEQDGLPLLGKIECLLDSNSPSARLKSASILLQSAVDLVTFFAPDVIVYPGDREDSLMASLIGAYCEIPTVHFYGGDHASDGNVDNPVRHAMSKLSTYHFVATDEHRARLLALGEPNERIQVTGSPSLDRFVETPPMSRDSVLRELGLDSWSTYALMIFHPISEDREKAGAYFDEILMALRQAGIRAVVSYPNVDAGNKQILEVIERCKADSDQFYFYKNLDRTLFVNLMRHARFLIGNSSAGLYEAPMVPMGVVNVGRRQTGRLAAANVLFVSQGVECIAAGIATVTSESFQQSLQGIRSPYGDGRSAERSHQLLLTLPFKEMRFKRDDPLNVARTSSHV